MGRQGAITRIAPALLLASAGIGVAATDILPASGRPSSALDGAASAQPQAKGHRAAWPLLDGAEARETALARVVTADLRKAGVPAPDVEVADIGAALGQFDPHAWVLQVSLRALVAVPSLATSPQARTLDATMHHEARHAEQWFLMAQVRAADGRSVDEIAAEMAVPRAVAVAAVAQPMGGGGKDAGAVRMWWASVYGPGATSRNQTIADLLAAKSAYDAAAHTYRTDPSPATGEALLQAKKDLQPAYRTYRALPEEADAFAAQAEYEGG